MNSGLPLEAQVESLLFFKGEPVKISTLAKFLKSNEKAILEAITTLENSLQGRGVQLISVNEKIELRTSPEMSEVIESIRKEELTKDLGKAGSETLAIVLYKGPLSRSEVDYVRGVNSTFILRNLLIRGLVEKVPNPKDKRSFLYKPTLELLSFIGIKKIEELPEFEKVKTELSEFSEKQNNEEESLNNNEHQDE